MIDLTRNFGKEAALTAGIDEAFGDAVVPIDADLQDPPELIPVLVAQWRLGAEVVLAQRSSRACDNWLKRTTAAAYYRVHNLLSDLKLPENVGDFRLMDRAVVNALKQLPERRRFMKGLFAWVGFKTVVVPYEREARSAGASKFSVGACGILHSKASRALVPCRCAAGPISAWPWPSRRSAMAHSSSYGPLCWASMCPVMPRCCRFCCSSVACN